MTLERGKISAFARGARRQGSRLAAATSPFSFGRFRVYEGRSSLTITEAEIQNYFEALRTDYVGAYYGMYFAEVVDYYGRENNDERELLGLLYQSMRALCSPALPNRLVKCVFEVRAIAVGGEYPGLPEDREYQTSTAYALRHIVFSPLEKLYTFQVKDEVLEELEHICALYRQRFWDREIKSLEILETLC